MFYILRNAPKQICSFCVKLHNTISQTSVRNQVCDLCAEYWVKFLSRCPEGPERATYTVYTKASLHHIMTNVSDIRLTMIIFFVEIKFHAFKNRLYFVFIAIHI